MRVDFLPARRAMLATLLASLAALPLRGGELEGTPWYDSEGRLVLVEGPAAEAAPQVFVPEWRQRELERARRMHAARSPWDDRPGYGSAYGSSDGSYFGIWGTRGWRGSTLWRGGSFVRPSSVFCRGAGPWRRASFHGAFRSGGLRVIIRR